MGKTFEFARKYLPKIDPNSVFVEIGSDRGEGSTAFLTQLAKENQTVLHTVDISNVTQSNVARNFKDIGDSIICHVQSGSQWAKEYGTTVGKPISLLYLDNFDWIWETLDIPYWIHNQINEYKNKFGIDMNNENCQQEHFDQMMYLYPWLTDNCLILLDDTYIKNQVWTGKCGPVVVWLKHQGFKILESTTACEVAMIRG